MTDKEIIEHPEFRLRKDVLNDLMNNGEINATEYIERSSNLYRAMQKIVSKINEPKVESKSNLKSEITNRSTSYGHSRSYSYQEMGHTILVLNQIPYPNCCGIAILKDLAVYGDVNKNVFIDAINDIISDLQNNDKFSKALIYTTKNSNEARLFSLYPGITILDSFKNRRSGHILIGFEIDLLRDQDEDSHEHVEFFEDNEEEIQAIIAEDFDLDLRQNGNSHIVRGGRPTGAVFGDVVTGIF